MPSRVDASIDELVCQPLEGRDLAVDVVDLDRAMRRLAAEKSRRLAAMDRSGGYAADHPSTVSWVRHKTNVGHGTAAAHVRVARLRDKLPHLVAAWAEGSVTEDHLTVVAYGVRGLPEELFGEIDDPLVTAAVAMNPTELGRFLRRLRDVLEPEKQPKSLSTCLCKRLTVLDHLR